MKSFFFKLFLLITVLIMSSGDLFAQYTWTKYEGNPLGLLNGAPGSWNRNVCEASVLYNTDSLRFEMWFSATSGNPVFPYRIGFATSIDGIFWNLYPNPVLTPTSGTWDQYNTQFPFVIRENGQYKMWYSSSPSNYNQCKIGYATSPDGINWTKLPNPIFESGTDPWEAGGVMACYVMPVSGGYKIWYSGFTTALTNGNVYIGYATSVDGISWQRDTINNPVLEPGVAGEWDGKWVWYPEVLFIDNLYYMYYAGTNTGYWGRIDVGLAKSADGITQWTKQPNPVLSPSLGMWDGQKVECSSIKLIGDSLWMWYSGNGSFIQFGLATSPYFPNALPPGTYTVGTNGNFVTIQEAFNKLETDGVAGNVTLELTDDLYTAPSVQFGFTLNGPIPGAGPNSRVTIKPAENKNVTIEGDGERVVNFLNTSYVTLDGVSLNGSSSLTVHNLMNALYQWNDCVDFLDNSDHNIVKNCILISDGYLKGSSGILFYPVNSLTEVPDSNLIENNFVKKAGVGIMVGGKNQTNRAVGNIIRGNMVGSEVDSLISWGIQDENTQNSIIENNIVQNINRQHNIGYYAPGINTAYSSGTTIRNNVVHKVSSSNVWGSAGILVSGESWAMGSNNIVYNNMVYDIQCTSTNSSSRLTGIQIFNQNNPKIYYNSVFLSGTGANRLGSAAFYIRTGCTNVDSKNNIFVNTRDESPYCASAIYDYIAANLTSDYNDIFYDATNNNNCLVRISGTEYLTLADWQALGKDVNSVSEMPNFIAPNLHLKDTVSYLESRGTPIAGVITDFDGNPRHATTPDIGADEFNGIVVGVEDEETLPTEFALAQNYPNPFNPSTKISWQSPVGSWQTLIVYDVLGSEIITLVDEYKPAGRYEVNFNATELASGIYFYKLQAGDYINTKKMILIK